VAALLMLAGLLSAGVAAARATATPRDLYRELLKSVPDASLPPALRGTPVRAARLSKGSKTHHAVGAVELSNGQAVVGFLVFPTRASAVADLKAFPPDRGPNRIVAAQVAGLPHPAYLLHARGNGYEVAYVVFVADNVLVNTWTYGVNGSKKQLFAVVERDARWARDRLRSAQRAAG
jgi:hypothetical protein